ncbi:MAG: hypothetical protein H6822_10555 [Planctomycetaceae bacterium]|nr:hypothetical protein [Planctomycetales bacterium]MCB9922613.1 hypothetical protein [Planctomycetaceae bacterium]
MESFRNGKLALEEATRACSLSSWKDPGCFNALAAAYAENSDFAEAVRWQTRAVEEGHERLEDAYRERLEVFRQGLPYRDRTED